MNESPNPSLTSSYRCRDCGSDVGFRSRRRTLTDHLLLLFLMKPVRCGECFRRDSWWIWTPVRDRLSDTSRVMPAKQPSAAASNRNVA